MSHADGGAQPRADEPLAQALSRIWLHELDTLEHYIPRVIEDLDPECLHQFRVALRRTRALSKVLGKWLPGHRPLADELKWLAAATGPLRDLDVHRAELLGWAQAGAAPPDRMRPALEAMRGQRDALHAALTDVLRGERCRELLRHWREFAQSLPGAASGKAAGRVRRRISARLDRLCRKLCRRGRRIGPGASEAELHQLRIRGKRLRYLLEAFAPALGQRRRTRDLTGTLKDLQTALGNHQDCVVARAYFSGLACEPGLPASAAFELGRWVRELESRQRAARADFDRRFAAFAARCRRRAGRG